MAKLFQRKVKAQKMLRCSENMQDGLNLKRFDISKEDNESVANAVKTFETHSIILAVNKIDSSCSFFSKHKDVDEILIT